MSRAGGSVSRAGDSVSRAGVFVLQTYGSALTAIEVSGPGRLS